MIPGDNLLYMALTLIASQTVLYYADAGRTKQPNGVFLTTYSEAQTIEDGSVQAIDRTKYLAMGLDFQKTYVTWFVPQIAMTTVQRAKSGDVIEWDGGRYQLESGITWNAQDGWGTAIACLIGPATGALNNG
jgi:hypothetical protein